MTSKAFMLQRICIFAGKEIDPLVDTQVETLLRDKFNLHLPQRRSLDEALASVASDLEIISLIIQYRALG